MSHIGEGGSDVSERLKAVGYESWQRCTENVAWNFTLEVDVVKAWMASPCHRMNILDPGVSKMGWGRDREYWTQVFSD